MNQEGGPRGERGAVQESGRKLLTAFYGAIQTLKLYPLENQQVQQALDDLHDVTGAIVRQEGALELRIVGDFFFLNETRLRLDLSNFSTFGSFASALTEHGIGAVEIVAGVERKEWAPFVSLLTRKADDSPFEDFIDRLAATPV